MPSDSSFTNRLPARSLPPVEPPSARFIVQLFLVPGLIVLVAVLIYLGSSYLVRSTQTPESYLRELDSTNTEIRWRGAHDLAQVLKRPESFALASNPWFALELTERLRQAAEELYAAEEATAKSIERAEEEYKKQGASMPQDEKNLQWRKLRQQRDLCLYLTMCLGDFTVPIGAPLLCEIAVKDDGAHFDSKILQRRRAVWALANMGNNYQRRYLGRHANPGDKVLTPEQKAEILETLAQEKKAGGQRGAWAGGTLDFLNGKTGSGVDAALEKCAQADDSFLRAQVALALNFWEGDRVEPTLLKLAHDKGDSKLIKIKDDD